MDEIKYFLDNLKVGDYFLDINLGDVEQIVKVEDNHYYFKTVKCVSGVFLHGDIGAFSLKEIKIRCEVNLWKKISNLQAIILTEKLDKS